MKLISVEPRIDLARELHQRLLAYKAVSWDLLHCADLDAALQLNHARGPFDAVFLGVEHLQDEWEDTYSRFCQLTYPVPVIALLSHPQESDVERLFQIGVQDTLPLTVDARYLMQRTRLAIQRQRHHPVRVPTVEPISQASQVAAEQLIVGNERVTTQATANVAANVAGGRLLFIEPNQELRDEAACALESSTTSWELVHAATIAEALTEIRSVAPELVVTELSLPDSEGVDTVTRLVNETHASVLVWTYHDDDETAIQCIQQGAEDVLGKSRLSADDLPSALRRVVTRAQARAARKTNPIPTNAASDKLAERRRSPRVEIARSVYAIPILPDGSPDSQRQAEGVSVDLSREGIGFLLSSDHVLNRRLLLGLEQEGGAIQFAAVEVKHVRELDGMFRYGAEIITDQRDPLRDSNLSPKINAITYQMELGLPLATLESWERLGVIHRMLAGRGYVCPDCFGVPLVRNGCKACGGARLTSSRLIHHFACAHVDHVVEFQRNEEMACPKCQAHALIAGTDFEYLNGPYQCLGCGWTDTDFETVGQCMHCNLRFPIHQASEEDFIGFHIERLDPMAFLGTS